MSGFLVPQHYHNDLPNESGMNLASVIWGLSLGIVILNCDKAIRQTRTHYRRRKRLTVYVALCWLEIVSSLVLGTLCWLYLRSVIQPSFHYFFSVSLLWSTQVQCLIQIIANRVGLLMVPRSHATRLKWMCFAIILCINISVIVIWVPARLQMNQQFIDINKIWDRIEKVIFAIIDAGLNIYFIYTVKKHLVLGGLHKYALLYRVNLVLAVISVSLDILLIAIMSLPNDYVYLQFHPVVYLLKLHIEMNMADLIGKVARASNANDLNSYQSRPPADPEVSRPQPAWLCDTVPIVSAGIYCADEISLTQQTTDGGSKKFIKNGGLGCETQTGVHRKCCDTPEHIEHA